MTTRLRLLLLTCLLIGTTATALLAQTRTVGGKITGADGEPLPGVSVVLNSNGPTIRQRGTTTNLKTNDTRVQSSYYENGRIEFVLNSAVNGMAGIYYGTGIISPPPFFSFSSFTGQTIGYAAFDIAYASIGFSDAVMAPDWKLLGAMEGINGALLLGWSVAFFVSVMTPFTTRQKRGPRPS